MELGLKIPRFADGEVVTETDLYQLAWLPLELQRLSNLARGRIGFFVKSRESAGQQNHFELTSEHLVVTDLYAISSEGALFILPGEHRVELAAKTGEQSVLFADAYFATSAKAFESDLFGASGNIDTAPEDSESVSSYQVLLHWGEYTSREIEGAVRFGLELGRLAGANHSSFEVTPTAYYPAALPILEDAVSGFARTLDAYHAFLFEMLAAPDVDRTTLLARLEGLQRRLRGNMTPTRQLVSDIHFLLLAVKGFYLRLAYAKDEQNPRYGRCRGLEGRRLEHQLEPLYQPDDGPLGHAISQLKELPLSMPETGSAQVGFFHELEVLLSVERSAELFRSRPTRPTPEPPRPPRSVRPIMINLEED